MLTRAPRCVQSVQVYQAVFGGPREGVGRARPTTEASAASMDKHVTQLAREAMRSYIAIVKTAAHLSCKLSASQTAGLQARTLLTPLCAQQGG